MNRINGVKWYTPREIAKLGLIQTRSGTNNEAGNYNLILELIKAGKIKAKNYNIGGKRPFWLVSELEINRYAAEDVYFKEGTEGFVSVGPVGSGYDFECNEDNIDQIMQHAIRMATHLKLPMLLRSVRLNQEHFPPYGAYCNNVFIEGTES